MEEVATVEGGDQQPPVTDETLDNLPDVEDVEAMIDAVSRGIESGEPEPIVTLEDLQVVREPDGSVVAFQVPTIVNGFMIEMRPLTLGANLRYGVKVEADVTKLPWKSQVGILREFVVKPSFIAVPDHELKENYDWTLLVDMVGTVVFYSRRRFNKPFIERKLTGKAGKE